MPASQSQLQKRSLLGVDAEGGGELGSLAQRHISVAVSCLLEVILLFLRDVLHQGEYVSQPVVGAKVSRTISVVQPAGMEWQSKGAARSCTCLTRWPVIVAELMDCSSLLLGLVCTLSSVDGQ